MSLVVSFKGYLSLFISGVKFCISNAFVIKSKVMKRSKDSIIYLFNSRNIW